AEPRLRARPVEDRLHELLRIVNPPEDEARGHDGVLAEGQELAGRRDQDEEAPVEPRDALNRREQLPPEPGLRLHAHGLAELGNDDEFRRTDREEAEPGEPDQDRAEAEEDLDPNCARDADTDQLGTSG